MASEFGRVVLRVEVHRDTHQIYSSWKESVLYRTFSLALVVDVEERLHILGVDLSREVVHNPADGTTRQITRADKQRTFSEVAFVEPC